MKQGFRRATTFVLACLALACGPSRTLPEDTTAPVVLGFIAPLSGELGADGQGWSNAVSLAVREVNAAGGVLPGRRVQLEVKDGRTLPEEGVRVARELVDMGAVGIIGDSTSSATLRVYQEVTLEAQVLLASGLSTSPQLTTINRELMGDWYFFRTVPPDDGQAPKLVDAMYDAPYACRRVAILFADNDYGQPFVAGMRQRASQLPEGSIVIEQPYTEARSSYAAEVEAIAAREPDCIALIGYPQSTGVILRNWAALTTRPEVLWFGTDGIRQAGLVREVGDAALLDGFLGTAPLTSASTPAYNRFARQYAITFGSSQPPTDFSSNLYDAAALMMLAIAKAGTAEDPIAIRDAVLELNDPAGTVVLAGDLASGLRRVRAGEAINYEGASGSVTVDDEGNVEGQYELWRFDTTSPTTGDFSRVRILE